MSARPPWPSRLRSSTAISESSPSWRSGSSTSRSSACCESEHLRGELAHLARAGRSRRRLGAVARQALAQRRLVAPRQPPSAAAADRLRHSRHELAGTAAPSVPLSCAGCEVRPVGGQHRELRAVNRPVVDRAAARTPSAASPSSGAIGRRTAGLLELALGRCADARPRAPVDADRRLAVRLAVPRQRILERVGCRVVGLPRRTGRPTRRTRTARRSRAAPASRCRFQLPSTFGGHHGREARPRLRSQHAVVERAGGVHDAGAAAACRARIRRARACTSAAQRDVALRRPTTCTPRALERDASRSSAARVGRAPPHQHQMARALIDQPFGDAQARARAGHR